MKVAKYLTRTLAATTLSITLIFSGVCASGGRAFASPDTADTTVTSIHGDVARVPVVVKSETEKVKFKIYTPRTKNDTIKVSSQEITGTYTVTITYNGQEQSQEFVLVTGTQKLSLVDLLDAMSVSDCELLKGMTIKVKLSVPGKQDTIIKVKVR